mgnify:CR=1 FL=1
MEKPRKPRSGPDRPLDSLTLHVFDAARAIESLRLAVGVRDDELAVIAAARLRARLDQVESAYGQLDDSDRGEAVRLVRHLERRAREALHEAPSQLVGAAAILRFLDRFGARSER